MWKRMISLVLALAVCFSLVPQRALAAEETIYLALGDSISAGVALGDPQSEAFAVLLKERLGESYRLVNMASEAGETTQTLLEKLGTEAYQTAVAQADVITITIGGNDLMALFYEFLANGMGMTVEDLKLALADGTDLAILTEAAKIVNREENGFAITEAQISGIMDRYAQVILAVRKLNPAAVLAVSTQYNPYQYLTTQVNIYYVLLPYLAPDYVPLADAIRKISGVIEGALSSFNSAIKAGRGYGVADVYTAFHLSAAQLCNAALEIDSLSVKSVNMDFHPNAAGHQLIAAAMATAIWAEQGKEPVTISTVSFQANGGTGEMADETIISGSYPLPQCGFTAPAGKVFAGWALSEDGEAISGSALDVTADTTLYALWADCPHSGGTATCKEQAVCETCGQSYGELAEHAWNQGEVTQEPTEEIPGICTFTCGGCGLTRTEEIPVLQPAAAVKRVAGELRFDTAIAAAKEMKIVLGGGQFENMILASGSSFADALTGSYLGVVKKAPILLYGGQSQEVNIPYIQQNLAPNGTLYILGGTDVIPLSTEEELNAAGIRNIRRLAGMDRFQTNLDILAEAGIGDKEIMIVAGWGFADSLSLSATGLPVLMVDTIQEKLTPAQIAFLAANKDHKITIAGGEEAVSAELEAAIEAVVGDNKVERVYGDHREATSLAIAREYFPNPSAAVIAYSWNFPDGLSGGPLAYYQGAPMLLTDVTETKTQLVNSYLQEMGISRGCIMGGTEVLSDDVARAVFGLALDAEIPCA